MEHDEYESAILQLAGAAELLAAQASADQQIDAQAMRAFFELQKRRLNGATPPQTSDDELFKSTAIAALEMAGRKAFPAAAALLEQARSLLPMR
jgi:hypothetical protein